MGPLGALGILENEGPCLSFKAGVDQKIAMSRATVFVLLDGQTKDKIQQEEEDLALDTPLIPWQVLESKILEPVDSRQQEEEDLAPDTLICWQALDIEV